MLLFRCVLLVFIFLVSLFPANAQTSAPSTADAYKSTKSALQAEAQTLAAQGYKPNGSEVIDTAPRTSGKRVPIQLRNAVPNAIIVACGECDRIEVSLYDYEAKLMTTATGENGVVIINGAPAYDGYHEVEIAIPGCRADQCAIGVLATNQTPAEPSAPDAAARVAPNEQLPPDIPVDDGVLKLIETHPFFANPPAVTLASYNVITSTRFITSPGNAVMTSSGDETTTIHWLRLGVVSSESTQEMTVRNAAGTLRSFSRTISVSAGNGLFALGSKTVTRNRFGNVTTFSHLTRFGNTVGTIFPIRVGRRFSYEIVTLVTVSSGYRDQITQNSSCEVTRQYEAHVFHSDLSGQAYLVVCQDRSSYRKNASANGTSQSNNIFFEDLGSWITADPVSPKEEVILDGSKSVTGKYVTKSNGFYHLKSFATAP